MVTGFRERLTCRSLAPSGVAVRLSRLGEFLQSELLGDTARSRLVRSAGTTAGLKAGATLLAFGASLLYARALGPHDYGLYAYVVAWVAVLTVPAELGVSAYLTREGAKAPGSALRLCRWADSWLVASSLIAGLFLAAAVLLPQAAGARWLFVIAAPLPLLTSLGNVRRALLQARGAVARAQWPLLVLAPALMLAALGALWLWRGRLDPVSVMAAMTGSALVPLVINDLQLRRAAAGSMEPAPDHLRLRAALPFMWLGGLFLLSNRVDLIMLGALKGAHAAGIYAIAARAAELVTFFLGAANMVLAPQIARLYHAGERSVLQRLLAGATRRVFLLSLPLALLFIIWASPLLGYVYGSAYAQGAIALRILAGAQLFNVFAGSTGTILNMTGFERLSMWAVGLAVLVNIVLNAILIPGLGIEGAAIATGVSVVAWNVVLWYWVRRRLRLRPSAIGY